MHLSKKDQAWWSSFQELLDDQTEWPSEYLFKFIVPKDDLEDLKSVFGHVEVEERASRKGNYISVTTRMEMHSSDEVIAIYKAAGAIDGVISL